MRNFKVVLILSFVAVFLSCGSNGSSKSQEDQSTVLSVGVTAPDFTLGGTAVETMPDQNEFSLYGSLDKGPVLLAFYPMAFTGG